MKQARILITGATGAVGTHLVKRIADLDIPFRVMVRTNDNGDLMRNLPNAEIVVGDMADRNSLDQALQGIEKAFLLTNSSEQAELLQMNFVDAAHQAGVKHIVKLSQFAADLHSPVRFLRYHAAVENHIKELGLTYTFLRPNLFMQGLIALRDYIRTDGQFYAAIGNATISAVDIRDIAAVAAASLTEDGHEDKVYNITGPEALTHYEMAAIFSRVLGRTITFIDIAPWQMEGALRTAGFPEWQVGGLLEDYAHYANGEAAMVYDTVANVSGHAPIRFEQFVNDYKSFFS